jgi:hypothetical protein
MSKISSDECFAIDMEWYGVDRQGNIAVFCSAGEGYLPEFVCEDKERADELIEYFNLIKEVPPLQCCKGISGGGDLRYDSSYEVRVSNT